jgi:hypothetical protein
MPLMGLKNIQSESFEGFHKGSTSIQWKLDARNGREGLLCIMDILVDLDASLVFPIAGVDCREEVDPVLAFRIAYGPPAALDADPQIAACPRLRLVDKDLK